MVNENWSQFLRQSYLVTCSLIDCSILLISFLFSLMLFFHQSGYETSLLPKIAFAFCTVWTIAIFNVNKKVLLVVLDEKDREKVPLFNLIIKIMDCINSASFAIGLIGLFFVH